MNYPEVSLPAFREGASLGQYRLIEQVGRGGEADVWSAWDAQHNRLVAFKMMFKRETDPVGESANREFLREAHLIARLQHPYIVPLYDYGEQSSFRYLVMRFMVGGSMLDLLRSGPLSPQEVARLAIPIAQSLDFIHANSIVHRDLKPGNVLLDSRKAPYLADFGLARELILDDTLPIHTAKGTLLYMSPEQWLAQPIAAQSDLFSLGILLFEMLTGQLPFAGQVILAIQQRQEGQTIPDPALINPALPSGIHDILRRLTSDQLTERPANATEPVGQLIDLLNVAPPVEIAAQQVADAHKLLYAALQTWTPETLFYPLSATEFALVASFWADMIDPPRRANRLILYGAFVYRWLAERLPAISIDQCWGKASADERREVSLIFLQQTPNGDPVLMRILTLIQTLSVDQALPEATEERLIALARLNLPTVSTTALDVLVRWNNPSTPVWRECDTAFDALLAELATAPEPLATAAIQAIIRVRSTGALRRIIAVPDRQLALHLLSEGWLAAHSLPPGLPWHLYLEAVLRIGKRQLFHRPIMQLVVNYTLTATACCLALCLFIYVTYRSPDFLNAHRVLNAMAQGLFFGIQIGLGGFVTQSIAGRLKVLSIIGRIFLGILIGGLITIWSFVNLHILHYDLPPTGSLIALGGFIFVTGFALGGVVDQFVLRALLVSGGVLLALLITWGVSLQTGSDPLLYFEHNTPAITLILSIMVSMVIGFVSQLHPYKERGKK
jgi:tRNA A-37 threonylcarbamoyl transferase component Bud32